MTLSARETLATVLSCGPLLQADAIVVLCGEDAEPRMVTAIGLTMQRAANYVVLTGGLDAGKRIQSARTLHPLILGKGVAPDRIIIDDRAMNTHEQAVNMVAMAKERGWHRLCVVASPYHCPRAFLTFVRALDDAGLAEAVHVYVVPCAHAAWFSPPAGTTVPRIDLVAEEYAKLETYADHVATCERGLAYLKFWEQGPATPAAAA